MTHRLLIWGASGHAKVVADAARQSGIYTIEGFLDDVHPERAGSAFFGGSILGGRDALDLVRARGLRHVVVAIGNNRARLQVGDLARREGFELATVVHPGAVIASSARLGPGSFVAAGAVINPDVVAGDGVIVNTSASVDHDCRLGDGVHVSPGAHLAGTVTVGDRSWIGVGAVVRDRINIGADTVVGAGAAVVRDLPAGVVAFGVPARVHSVTQQPATR